jgi:hypothetical protein
MMSIEAGGCLNMKLWRKLAIAYFAVNITVWEVEDGDLEKDVY